MLFVQDDAHAAYLTRNVIDQQLIWLRDQRERAETVAVTAINQQLALLRQERAKEQRHLYFQVLWAVGVLSAILVAVAT